MKKFNLTDLDIEEISLVDVPANPGAMVMLQKFAKPNKQEETKMNMEEIAKKLDETLAAVTKSNENNAKLETLVKFTDVEKAHYFGLDEKAQAEFLKLDSTARAAAVAKAKEDKEKDDLAKSANPELTALQKRADEQAAEIKKMKEEAALAEFTKKAETELPNLAGTPEEKGALMKSLFAMPEAERKVVMENLKKADTITKSYMQERGSAFAPGGDTAEGKLEALAKKHAADNKVTYEKAYDTVLQTEEGKALYQQSQQAA